jgi:peptidyl-prolyl cis-trans isomerase SurA
MKKVLLIFFSVIFSVISCKTPQSSKSETSILFSVGDDPVTSDEFVYVFTKNNTRTDSLSIKEEVENYLGLYVNFKLKVKEAEAQGVHLTDAFKDELNGYRKQLAKPYLSENEVTEKLVEQAYERMKEEINASHILVTVNQDADPADTLDAYNKIKEIRNKALKGEDFNQLARMYSNDPSAKTNGGNLGYFTALQMVYPFEDAAYKGEVGDITQPIRTRFGYHILKINDRRPSQGKIRVAHLMIRAADGIAAEDSVAAKKKADEIYAKLVKGEEWDELVQQFTEDPQSKPKNGTLPWFGTGNMVPSFEAAAFALKENGEISKPIKTPYGWHIIKRLDHQHLEPFEELQMSIKTRVSRDSRSDLNKKMLIKRLKKENSFEENTEVLEAALNKADSSLLQSQWKFKEEKQLDKVLFTVNKKPYLVRDFYTYVAENQTERQNIAPKNYMRSLYTNFMEDELINYEESQLDSKYEEFRMLVKEYRDGILLFQMMDDMVWSKAIADSVGLRQFFEENKDNYKWPERIDAVIYNAESDQVIKELKKKLKQKDFFKSTLDKKITFEPTVTHIDAEGKEIVRQIIGKMKEDDQLTLHIEVSGKVEEKPFNEERLTSVQLMLMEKGVSKRRVNVVHEETKAPSALRFDLKAGQRKQLERALNVDSPLAMQIEEGLFAKGDMAVLDKIEWKEGEQLVKHDGRVYLIDVKAVLPVSIKEFEEVRGMVISDYQNYLEEKWVAELKAKYPVKINDRELEKTIKRIEAQ